MGRVFRAEADIDAPPSVVWGVLVDLAAYPEWNPFTIEVRSSLRVGEPVHMHVHMSRWGRAIWQREIVSAVEPERQLCWGMTMLGSLVRAERRQGLERLDSQRTRYVTEDRIEGALSPLVFAMFGRSVQEGFEGVARGLKVRAEALARGA